MALGLCHFLHMKQYRYMMFPAKRDTLFVHLAEPGVIPSFGPENLNSFTLVIQLKSPQYFRNILLRGLVMLRTIVNSFGFYNI